MTEEKKIEVINQFINEYGLWNEFKSWLEQQGYSVEEMGFPTYE